MNYSLLFRICWSFFSVLVLSSFAIAQIGWQAQTNGVPAGKNLYALKAITTSEVWICGADGVILKTTNGGDEWVSANPPVGGVPVTEQLAVLEIFNSQRVWVGSTSGKIYFTTNAGASWTRQFDSASVAGAIATIKRTFLNRAIAIADAPSPSSLLAVLASTNAGSTWTNINTNLIGGIVPRGGADFQDANRSWVWSSTFGLRHSTDGGVTWTARTIPGLNDASDITFVNATEGYITTSTFIWRTIDGGASWAATVAPTSAAMNAAGFAIGSPYRFAAGTQGTILVSTDTGMTWQGQQNKATQTLNAISFASATTGWVVGNQGTVLKTGSAGVLPGASAWQTQTHATPSGFSFRYVKSFSSSDCSILGNNAASSVLVARTTNNDSSWTYNLFDLGFPTANIMSYDFASSAIACVGTSTGTILRTTNSGVSWSAVFQLPSTVLNIRYLRFFNLSEGVAVGDAANAGAPLAVLGTTDGGTTWNSQSTAFSGARTVSDAVGFFSRSVGLLVTLPTDVYQYTTNGGQTWTQYPEHPRVTYFHFVDPQVVFGIGIEAPLTVNGIYRSTNAGMSWTLKTTSGVQAPFNNFSIAGARVWSLHGVPDPFTGYGRMKYSTDLGETWSLQPLATSEALVGVSFASQTDGWAIAARTILHTTTGGVTSVGSPLTLDRPATFRLEQNYPNPFNPTTEIRFQISEVRGQKSAVSHVTLKVYDVLGREVATLVNEQKQPSSYSVTWDAHGVSSGVYFYTLRAGEFFNTRKMLLTK